MPAHWTTYVILVPLVALIVWRRIRRQFGRQPIRRKRMTARIAILAVVVLLLALAGLRDLHLAEGLMAGLSGGGLVGLVGLRLTRFEADPEKGDCYVPNTWIGALLTALLLGRLAYRFAVVLPQMQAAASPAGGPPQGYVSSPLTMLVVGLLIGYYLAYSTGLLIHHRRFQASRLATGPLGGA